MEFNAAIDRLRATFLEMPGLWLTVEEAQRLCHLDRGQCEAVLSALVRTRFLTVKTNGAYGRISEGDALPRREKTPRQVA